MAEIDIEKFADDLVSLDVKQLQTLKKVLKDKYGLEETIPVAAPAAVKEEPVKIVEKSHVNINLTKVSEVVSEKLNAVKVINRLINVGLKPAMDLTKQLPSLISENVVRADAEQFKTEMAALNCEVELV